MQLETSSTKVMCSHIPTISFASTRSLAHLWSLASHNPAEIKAISRMVVTTNLFPLSRCASTIQIVRPLGFNPETHPQLQLALLRDLRGINLFQLRSTEAPQKTINCG